MLQNHVILCGLGRVGRRVLDYLQAANVPVVAIDSNLSQADEAAAGDVRYLRGDFRKRELLERAGVSVARGILILTSDDLANLSTLMTALKIRPDLRAVVRMFNPSLIARLGDVTKNVFALSTSALTAPMLALIAHTGGALAAFRLGDDAVAPTDEGDDAMLIADWTLPPQHSLVGATLGQFRQTAQVEVVACGPALGERRFFAESTGDETLAEGDRLIVCGRADVVERLTGVSEADAFGRRGWFDAPRRFARMAGRVLAEIDAPVKICTLILVSVILLSMALFRFGMKHDTYIDAFYRTISLMATGADMQGNDADPGSWQKAFISALRLLGAALTAAFTAILTNYLVRAHLRGALDVRRIPDRGHVIVTGLGNVGFRVVQELIRLGDRVVAVERNRDNPFIATARRLGVVVIVGDATVAEVLKQAHAGAAKSILVATENELTNLEIALLVRELHPDKRLLVRLIDPQLAGLLREAANIRLALSVPELAAPAFLAAFVGDRIRTVLLAHGRILAVVDVKVDADDALAGRSVGEWAARYRLLPLAATTRIGADLASTPLPSGATLTALVTFNDVHAVFQRRLRK